jgi:hypothetical protein
MQRAVSGNAYSGAHIRVSLNYGKIYTWPKKLNPSACLDGNISDYGYKLIFIGLPCLHCHKLIGINTYFRIVRNQIPLDRKNQVFHFQNKPSGSQSVGHNS